VLDESTNATNELSIAEDQKLSAVKKVNETTPIDTPYPDVLEEESTNATNELSIADQKPSAVKVEEATNSTDTLLMAEDQKPSAVKVKENTPIDTPYPDVLLEEEPTEGVIEEEQQEMQPQQLGLQDEQQQLSTAEDQKPSAVKVEEETTIDKEGAVKEAGEEQPEMKSPLQMFGIDNDRKVPSNEQLQVGHRDVSTVDSAEYMYSKLMSSLE
jgi:hypothetical protein